MTRAVSQSPPAQERLADYRWPLAGAVVLLCIYVWLFWDFIGTQVRWGIKHQADWGHTLVIPFIAGYLVYHNREKLRRLVPFRTSWTGLIPIVAGVAWYSVCTLNDAVRNHNLQGFGVWLALFGLVLLFCGYRAMAYLWFPLVYMLVFGQSVSDRAMNVITFQLQDIAARGSHIVLLLLGFDAEAIGQHADHLRRTRTGEPAQHRRGVLRHAHADGLPGPRHGHGVYRVQHASGSGPARAFWRFPPPSSSTSCASSRSRC